MGSSFLESVRSRMRAYKRQGEGAMEQLHDPEFNFRPNQASNSMAQIVQHLSGNMRSRWTHFLTEDGEKPWRQRDEEFADMIRTKVEVMASWDSGWAAFLDAIDHLRPDDLQKTITIRGESLTVLDAILRQVAHYASHVGQMLYLAKIIRGETWISLSIPKGGSEAYNREKNR